MVWSVFYGKHFRYSNSFTAEMFTAYLGVETVKAKANHKKESVEMGGAELSYLERILTARRLRHVPNLRNATRFDNDSLPFGFSGIH